MFTEKIAVYSEITAEYINKFVSKLRNFKVVTNDTFRHLCGLILENIILAIQIFSGRTKA
jgi:hypothetical protein